MSKRWLSAALAALVVLAAVPLRAEESPPTAQHRLGVILMVVCGVSARAATVAPVPFAGIAAASCLAGCLDALTDPD